MTEKMTVWIAALNEKIVRIFSGGGEDFRPVDSLILTEETPVLLRRGGAWRSSFLNASCTLLQRAAERQAFDNLLLVGATCLLDGLYAVMDRALREKTCAALPETALLPGTSAAGRTLGRDDNTAHDKTGRTAMQGTRVKELMEEMIITVPPEATLADAARLMKDNNCGCLLVGDGGTRPEGVITDRDIVVRALARDVDPAVEKVRDTMTGFVTSCTLDDTLAQAAELMRENAVSRMVVTDAEGHACGILSFGRILRNHDDADELAEVVACATGRKNVMAAKASLTDNLRAH